MLYHFIINTFNLGVSATGRNIAVAQSEFSGNRAVLSSCILWAYLIRLFMYYLSYSYISPTESITEKNILPHWFFLFYHRHPGIIFFRIANCLYSFNHFNNIHLCHTAHTQAFLEKKKKPIFNFNCIFHSVNYSSIFPQTGFSRWTIAHLESQLWDD